jgi:formate dehydrogenase/NADH-quinone oxidoreductase subunit F
VTERKQRQMARLIPRLQEVQHEAGWLSADSVASIAKELELPVHHVSGVANFYPGFRRTPPPRTSILICQDLACNLKHGGQLVERAQAFARRDKEVEIKSCSCLGQCDVAPAVMIDHVPVGFGSERAVIAAIEEAVNGKFDSELPALEYTGEIQTDPYENAADRYGALREVAKDPQAAADGVIQKLLDAGLRGMGGGGFPVGQKWKLMLGKATQAAPHRYIVCNADESEVGTFKDRELLGRLPHLVIEGMAIAALISNTRRGYLYVRHEYVQQIEVLKEALAAARKIGAIGPNIFGTGREFEITLFVSAGGYIQGEASALMEAIEGKRGQPRNGTEDFGGSVRSTVKGLFGHPTLVNNVESFVFVPAILQKGAEWFGKQGVGDNPGLKWIGVAGDVEKPQVMEVPHGLTYGEALDRCGGMRGGRKLKAIMPGGPSFGFLPPDFLDAEMAFPNKEKFGKLAKAGATIGSGAVMFLDDTRDLVDAALNCTRFYRNESCGKCVPCRIGAQKMVNIIKGVRDGSARADHVAEVENLAQTLYLTSICGLGQVVPKPFESVVKYWGDEDERIRKAIAKPPSSEPRAQAEPTTGDTRPPVNVSVRGKAIAPVARKQGS